MKPIENFLRPRRARQSYRWMRPVFSATACLAALLCTLDALAAANEVPIVPRTVAEAKALQARVDRETAAAS
jgi:hypothetical protein